MRVLLLGFGSRVQRVGEEGGCAKTVLPGLQSGSKEENLML